MNDLYDVVVVGAGPAGAATAHYLAKTGCKVLLLDKFTFPRDKTCGDALTPRALRILDEMGMLGEVAAAGHQLDKVAFFALRGHRVLAPLPQVRDGYGYLLFTPRLFLDHILVKRALASGAELQAPVRVTSLERDENGMLVKGVERDKERALPARMVVLAEQLTWILAQGDFSSKQLAAYDQQLRQRYQRLFVLCDRLRFFYLNPLILNQIVRAVAQKSELME